MKKLLLAFSILISADVSAVGQTTATNFTATDCNGAPHTLFNELDNGKIVVLVWIMPCATCINDARGAYDAVQAFATSHPGRVLYYLTDDIGDDGCSTISSWATARGIGSDAIVFGNSGTPINENDFGGSGMPHVVVIGGANHQIYFNKLNGSNSRSAIESAISTALSATTSVAQVSSSVSKLLLYPNPAQKSLSVKYSLADARKVTIGIFDVRGTLIKDVSTYQSAGDQRVEIPLDGSFSNGYYLLKINGGESSLNTWFTIAESW